MGRRAAATAASGGGGRRRAVAATVIAAREPLGRTANRPSKTAAKEAAQRYQDLARELIRTLTDRQTARLAPLIGTDAVEAAAAARSIAPRSGGRSRQEALVARLLREEVQLEQFDDLEEAVQSLQLGQGFVANPAAAQRAELWLEGLLDGQAEVATEVAALARAVDADMQRILQLARQAQKASSSGGSSDGAVAADEAGAAHAADKAAAKRAQKVLKQLRVLLLELAEAEAAEMEQQDD